MANLVLGSAFCNSEYVYPSRRVTHEDAGDPKMGSQPATALNTLQGLVAGKRGEGAPSSGGAYRPGISSGLAMSAANVGSSTAAAAAPPRKRTKLNR